MTKRLRLYTLEGGGDEPQLRQRWQRRQRAQGQPTSQKDSDGGSIVAAAATQACVRGASRSGGKKNLFGAGRAAAAGTAAVGDWPIGACVNTCLCSLCSASPPHAPAWNEGFELRPPACLLDQAHRSNSSVWRAWICGQCLHPRSSPAGGALARPPPPGGCDMHRLFVHRHQIALQATMVKAAAAAAAAALAAPPAT